ncbi:MAG: acyltransferase [Flavobacterium sp.]|uniref:acyltransferase family protein n=1 Tax=Flavobacterium sp. TaxID=239 RepID=UPI003263475C
MENKSNRIPSLDGLRAISILLVVFGHAFKIKFIDIANLGVRMFFIISSFLIVGILLKDVEKNRFSIKQFYFKRVMRTFPAFYVYLLSVFCLLLFLNIFEWEQFWRAPVYLENYHSRTIWNDKQWFVGHTWSLAVEEQFYIVVALLFLLVNKKYINKNKLVKILIVIIVLIPFIRVGYMFLNFIPDVFRGSMHRSFETVSDSLAIGGIMALTKEKVINSKIFNFLKNNIFLLIVIVLAIQFLNSSYLVEVIGLRIRYIYNFFGLTIINFSMVMIMMVLIYNPNQNFITKQLNKTFLITIGLWSYSIYLWQQLWLYSWSFSIYYKFVGILVCSILSYYCIELPFLKIRDNYLRKKIQNEF